MGMYTQFRGWLCLDSISGHNTDNAIQALEALKERFKKRDGLDRTWVADDAWIHPGSNGSLWLFIGTEHTNYDESMREWISAVVELFPRCEGRIDIQYEETYEGDDTPCLLISEGKINEVYVKAWTKGYGLDWALSSPAVEASAPPVAVSAEGSPNPLEAKS